MADADGKVHCAFVMRKTRLAPLKAVTVPRLELQAATLAARQDQFLRRELDIELGESTFWSDSTAVLLNINNTSKQGRSQTFSFGGDTGGASFATSGAVNGLCRTFRKRPSPPLKG